MESSRADKGAQALPAQEVKNLVQSPPIRPRIEDIKPQGDPGLGIPPVLWRFQKPTAADLIIDHAVFPVKRDRKFRGNRGGKVAAVDPVYAHRIPKDPRIAREQRPQIDHTVVHLLALLQIAALQRFPSENRGKGG